MKNSIFLFLVFILGACGTQVKIQTSGSVGTKNGEAPVLLQYRFLGAADEHEIFFLDEDRKRFNVKVSSDIDTAKGIVVYLPVGKRYVISSVMHVKNSARTEYIFGPDLTLFELKPDYVNRLPYFEFVSVDGGQGKFILRGESPAQREALKKEIRKNFQLVLPIRGLVLDELAER